jgi:hypothetical protein
MQLNSDYSNAREAFSTGRKTAPRSREASAPKTGRKERLLLAMNEAHKQPILHKAAWSKIRSA